MGTRAIFALASDHSGERYYNTALEVVSDGRPDSLEYLAQETSRLVSLIEGFDIQNEKHIQKLRNELAISHAGWIFLVEADQVNDTSYSCIYNAETRELEIFSGYFEESLQVIVTDSSDESKKPIFIFVVRECHSSAEGITKECFEVTDEGLSTLDSLVQTLISAPAVIEIVVSHQSDMLERDLIPEMILEKLDKPARIASLHQ